MYSDIGYEKPRNTQDAAPDTQHMEGKGLCQPWGGCGGAPGGRRQVEIRLGEQWEGEFGEFGEVKSRLAHTSQTACFSFSGSLAFPRFPTGGFSFSSCCPSSPLPISISYEQKLPWI